MTGSLRIPNILIQTRFLEVQVQRVIFIVTPGKEIKIKVFVNLF